MSKKRVLLETDLSLRNVEVEGFTMNSNTNHSTTEVGESSGVQKGEQDGCMRSMPTNNTNEHHVPFVNLFKNNRMVTADNKLTYMETGTGTLKFGFDEIESIENTYGYCLLGFVIGGRPPTAALFDLIKRWGSHITFKSHVSGWILFSFPTADVRDRVLCSGNHIVSGFYLFLKEVPRCFRFCVEDLSSLPVWVQLHGLPPDCWTTSILSKITSRIGVPIHMDSFTRDRKRLKFARVLAEIDANNDRVGEMQIELPTGMVNISVVYEQNFSVCEICRLPGHTKERCYRLSDHKEGAANDTSKQVFQRYRSRSSFPRRNGLRGRSRGRPPKHHSRADQPNQIGKSTETPEIKESNLFPHRASEIIVAPEIKSRTTSPHRTSVIDTEVINPEQPSTVASALEIHGTDAVAGKSHHSPPAKDIIGDGGFTTVTNKKGKKAKKIQPAKVMAGSSNRNETWQNFVGDMEDLQSSDTEYVLDSPTKQEVRFFGKKEKGRQPKIASVHL